MTKKCSIKLKTIQLINRSTNLRQFKHNPSQSGPFIEKVTVHNVNELRTNRFLITTHTKLIVST